MAAGFQSTLQATGRADVALVMRGGSQAELNSGLSRDQGTLIKQAPGIRQDEDGRPIASAEMVVIAELLKTGEKTGIEHHGPRCRAGGVRAAAAIEDRRGPAFRVRDCVS